MSVIGLCVNFSCSVMDLYPEVPIIKAEPVEHEVNTVGVLHSEIDVECTDIKEECLTQCSDDNHSAGK